MARHADWPSRFEGHDFPQSIPDPDDVLAGAPAPWAALPTDERTGIDLATVRRRLEQAGRVGALTTYPEPAQVTTQVIDGVEEPFSGQSAVLVALFEEAGSTHVVLTRRSFELRFHSGEIALPGGRRDPGESPIDTALREAREEVGIAEGSVQYVGWLSPLMTLASGSSISPIVGRLAERPELVIDQAEVDRAFTVSLDELLADGAYLQERWRREFSPFGSDPDGFFPIYFYRVPGDLIWGATARVLTELLCLATGVGWADPQ